MAALDRISLKKFFSLFPATHVLGTTYSLSLVFFETVVLPLLRERLEGCVLLTDRLGLMRATQEAGALREAARTYAVAAVPHRRAFHPKVWVLIGGERAVLLVGSGNLTQAGMVDNLEAFEAVELTGANAAPGVAAEVLEFVRDVENRWPIPQREAVPALRILATIRRRLESITDTTPIGEDRQMFFMSSLGGAFPDQWRAHIGAVKEAHVAAPYFAGKTRGLELLRQRLTPKRLIVYPARHSDNGIDLPWEQAAAMPGTELRELPWSSASKRFSHLKLYGLKGANGSHWLFTGSVNGTGDALAGENVEAGLLRRVDTKTWRTLWLNGERMSAAPLAALDETERAAARLFLFHATETGTGFELVATDHTQAALLPLRDVEIVWSSGVCKRVATCCTLFTRGVTTQVRLSEFSKAEEEPNRCGMLRLSGTTTTGEPLQGAAFVDDVETLLSSPIQRRALSCALDLVDSEGLPDWTSLASFFGLLEEIIAEDDETQAPAEKAPSARAETTHNAEPEPELMWPPHAAGLDQLSPAMRGDSRSFSWLERILHVFVADERDGSRPARGPREAEDASDEELKASGESDEEMDNATEDRVRTDAEKQWERACAWLENWKTRERSAILDATHARRWPPASLLLARWIFRLRRKLRRAAPSDDWPPPQQLGRDFLRRMLDDRQQQEEDLRPMPKHYSRSVFPALLTDAADHWSWQAAESDAMLIVALCGYLHACAQHDDGHAFPMHWWLSWQRRFPVTVAWIDEHMPALCGVLRHTLLGEDEALPTAAIESAFRALPAITWEEHLGVQRLRHLQGIARQGDAPTEEVRELGNFLHRVKNDGSSRVFYSAPLGTRRCLYRGCPQGGIMRPEIRDGLRRQIPVICPSCGAVAVPSSIYDACQPL